MRKPTPEEIQNACGLTVPDIIAPGLQILFCGINPSLYSAAAGHHFARPGNRFWPALHAAGLTPCQLAPGEDRALLAWGYGVTNVVDRATARADELSVDELVAGARSLAEKVRRYRPRILAILGIGAYRSAFARPHAELGRQPERIDGTEIHVLPNPSGLNAHYRLAELAECYRGLLEGISPGRTR